MKKKIFIVLLLSLVIFSVPLSLYAMEYSHTLEVKDMQFSWTIEGDQIHVKLSAKTTGWVSIGFDPETAMQGANIIIGMVEKGKIEVADHYGDRKRGHRGDEDLGGKNNVINPSGSEKGGVTTISFTFPLNTGDAYDKPINPNGMSRVMLAYGSGRDSFRSSHPYRTVYEINYSTGENKKIK